VNEEQFGKQVVKVWRARQRYDAAKTALSMRGIAWRQNVAIDREGKAVESARYTGSKANVKALARYWVAYRKLFVANHQLMA
jgi:hypothetical protein